MKMNKTKCIFDAWNTEKQHIDIKWKFKRIKVWEIWLCKIWINIWWEISKDWKFSRPVLVVSNKLWWDLVWVIPITSIYNENNLNSLCKIENHEKYWLNRKSFLILNQFKIISLKRLEMKFNWYYRSDRFLPLISLNKVNYYLNKLFFIIKNNP